MKKKLTAFVLVFAMVFTLVPAGLVYAAEAESGADSLPYDLPFDTTPEFTTPSSLTTIVLASLTAVPAALAWFNGASHTPVTVDGIAGAGNVFEVFSAGSTAGPWGMFRDINVLGSDMALVEEITFDLYVATGRNPDFPNPDPNTPMIENRFTIDARAGGTFHGNWTAEQAHDYIGGSYYSIGGFDYQRVSVRITYDTNNPTIIARTNEIRFDLTLRFETLHPVYIANVMLHYPTTQADYDVIWHTNGGMPVPTQNTVPHGGTITAPANISRSGYTFDGWFTNGNLTTAASFPVTNVQAGTPTTFHARWVPDTASTPYPDWKDVELLHMWHWDLGNFTGGGSPTQTIALDGVHKTAFMYQGGNWGVNEWHHFGGSRESVVFFGENDIRDAGGYVDNGDWHGATRIRYTILIPQMLTVPTVGHGGITITATEPRLALAVLQGDPFGANINPVQFTPAGSDQDGWTWSGDQAVIVNGLPYRMLSVDIELPAQVYYTSGVTLPIGTFIDARYVENSAGSVFILEPQIYIEDEITIADLAPGLYAFFGNTFPGILDRTPLSTEPIAVSNNAAGTNPQNVQAYRVQDALRDVGVVPWEWMQNPFRFVPDPLDGLKENISGISFTAYMPTNIRGLGGAGENVPHMRFDYTVLPVTRSFGLETNAAGLLVQPWLIPQGVVRGPQPPFWTVTNAFASGIYNNVPGAIPEGPRPLENYSFNFNERVYVNGDPYIRIDYTINFNDLVPIVKEELIFTFSLANLNFDAPVFISDIQAIYHTGPWGGNVITEEWDDVIFMDGMTYGKSINNFHVLTGEVGLVSNHRGTWGGHQSRMVVTDDGVFFAYVYKLPGDSFGYQDGYAWNDRRRVAFVMQPADCPDGSWVILGEWQHNSNIPIVVSDAQGNVYMVMWEGIQYWPALNYRPSVTKFTAGSWNHSSGQLTTPLQFNVWHDVMSGSQHGGEYTSANISPDGIIYLMTVDNDRGGSGDGYIDIVTFNTITSQFTGMGRLWTGMRHGYIYLNFVSNNTGGYDVELIGNRIETRARGGYPAHPQGFNWLFDGFTYWRIGRELTGSSGPHSSLPPTNQNPSRAVSHYVTLLQETPLLLADSANYQGTVVPHIYGAGTGDVFWDINGDIHMIYGRQDTTTNMASEMWHMLIRNGEVIFNQRIFSGRRTLLMMRTSEGSYFLLESDFEGANTRATLHSASTISDNGWTFEPVGSFTLPLAMRIYGYSQAFINGISGHGDAIHVVYPVRGPLWVAGGGQADEWAYFILMLEGINGGDNGTDDNGTDDNGTDDNGTDDNGTDNNNGGTGNQVTGDSGDATASVITPPSNLTPETILVGDENTSVNVRISNRRATLNLPSATVREIIDSSEDSGVVSFDVGELDVDSIVIPRQAMRQFSSAEVEMELILPHGTLALDKEAVTFLGEHTSSGNVEVRITPLYQSAPDNFGPDAVLHEVTISVGTQAILEFDGTLTVTLPFGGQTVPEVWLINEDGTFTLMDVYFDAESEVVIFDTSKLGVFVITTQTDDDLYTGAFTDAIYSGAIYSEVTSVSLQIGSNLVTLNGVTTQSENTPFIDPETDRTMLPLRLIAESMGLDVFWNDETRSVTIVSDSATINLAIDEELPDGIGSAMIVDDRTFVSLRFIAESLGLNVYWDEESQTVSIAG